MKGITLQKQPLRKTFRKIQVSSREFCEIFKNTFFTEHFRWLLTTLVPFDETHLVLVRGLINQEVSPKCVNEESSTKRRSDNRQVNRSPQL